jgi:preprotein translocase subunit SecD
MRRPAAALLALLFVVATLAACGLNVPPTPTPRPCWVAFAGEYRLTTDEGAQPSAEQLLDAARTIDARLRAMGVAEVAVTPVPPDRIEVALPAMGEMEEARRLITARGDLLFVPVPPGQPAEIGATLPPGPTPLFGREGIASAAVAQDQAGRQAVDLVLTADAAAFLDAHAGAHLGEQLAIVSDGVVFSAPTLNATRFGGRLQISGGFDDEHAASRLVALLQLPLLPGNVEEVSFTELALAPGCNAGG